MNAIEVAQNHFNSWNRHDADAFVAAGASFVQVEGDKIRSEHVYVDLQTVAELLGLKGK